MTKQDHKKHSKSKVQQAKNRKAPPKKKVAKVKGSSIKRAEHKADKHTQRVKLKQFSSSEFESRVYDPTTSLEVEDLLPNLGVMIVKAISSLCNSCPEFVAAPILCILSLALSNRYRIRPDPDNKAYLVSPNLSGVIIAPPGSNKSSPLQLLMKIIKSIEMKFAKQFEDKSKEFAKDLIQKQLDNEYFKKEARRLNNELHTLTPNSNEALEVREKLERMLDECTELPKQIYSTILSVQDPTLKGLMHVAENQTVPVIIYKDEMAVFLEDVFDRRNGDLRRYLIEAIDGKSHYTNVTANKRSHAVRPPVVSIIGTTQPSVMNKLISKVLSEKVPNDGYLDRLQCIAYPNPNDMHPAVEDNAVADKTIDKLTRLFTKLYMSEKDEIIEVNLSKKATITFEKFKAYLANWQKSDVLHEHVKNKLSKYPDMVLSLALVIAVLRQYEHDPKSLLTLKTLKSDDILMASRWARHYLQHLRKLWGSRSPKMQNALKILKHINKLIDKDRCFTTRSITQKNWAGIKDDNTKAKDALQVLVDEGVIKSVNSKKKTGRPSIKWQLIVEIID